MENEIKGERSCILAKELYSEGHFFVAILSFSTCVMIRNVQLTMKERKRILERGRRNRWNEIMINRRHPNPSRHHWMIRCRWQPLLLWALEQQMENRTSGPTRFLRNSTDFCALSAERRQKSGWSRCPILHLLVGRRTLRSKATIYCRY